MSILEDLKSPKNVSRNIIEEQAKTTAIALLRLTGLEGETRRISSQTFYSEHRRIGKEDSLD